jgi:hypothetical protein
MPRTYKISPACQATCPVELRHNGILSSFCIEGESLILLLILKASVDENFYLSILTFFFLCYGL